MLFYLKSAYDRVQRPLLWEVLQRLGIHGDMLAAILSLYANSVIAVNVNSRSGQPFASQAVVPHDPHTIWALY